MAYRVVTTRPFSPRDPSNPHRSKLVVEFNGLPGLTTVTSSLIDKTVGVLPSNARGQLIQTILEVDTSQGGLFADHYRYTMRFAGDVDQEIHNRQIGSAQVQGIEAAEMQVATESAVGDTNSSRAIGVAFVIPATGLLIVLGVIVALAFVLGAVIASVIREGVAKTGTAIALGLLAVGGIWLLIRRKSPASVRGP